MDSCSMANWSRQDSSSKFRYEGKFSSAWFDISKSAKTTLGSSYMYRYDRCRSLISCLSAFLRLFLVSQLGERLFRQLVILFAINTKRTISDTNNRSWIFIRPSTCVKFRFLHLSCVLLCFSFRFSLLNSFVNWLLLAGLPFPFLQIQAMQKRNNNPLSIYRLQHCQDSSSSFCGSQLLNFKNRLNWVELHSIT